MDRLLLPLSTQLVICRNHDPYAQLGIADLMKNINSRSKPQKKPQLESSNSTADPLRVPPWPSNNIAASMPRMTHLCSLCVYVQPNRVVLAPDAFPPKVTVDRRKKKLSFDLTARRSRPVHKQYPARREQEIRPPPSDDDEPAMVRLPTRVLRHFGIFCTGSKRPSQQFRR